MEINKNLPRTGDREAALVWRMWFLDDVEKVPSPAGFLLKKLRMPIVTNWPPARQPTRQVKRTRQATCRAEVVWVV